MKRALMILAIAVLVSSAGSLAYAGGGGKGCAGCGHYNILHHGLFGGGMHGHGDWSGYDYDHGHGYRHWQIFGYPYGPPWAHRSPYGLAPQAYGPGPLTATTTYPYYTLRGPRDFLMDNPPSIGH